MQTKTELKQFHLKKRKLHEDVLENTLIIQRATHNNERMEREIKNIEKDLVNLLETKYE